MKVRQKHIQIRDDCFNADERGVSVRIMAYRNRVHVMAQSGDWTVDANISLEQLFHLLRNADRLDRDE